MNYWYLIALFLVTLKSALTVPVTDNDSLVVSSTENSNKEDVDDANKSDINPQIYSMQIEANVSNRFARTLITSKVRNLKKQAEETTFSVILPENAFISEFEMEIKGKIYKAYVKEKKEAKAIYQQAVASGQSAAHVELNARDSKTFTVSVNIEPESKTIFRLVYEELLQRHLGQYELVVNIHPGQIVKDLDVKVHINESRPLIFVKTPSLRTGNEISKNDEKLDPSAQIDIINSTSANVSFKPNANQQKAFAESLGGNKEIGLAGQFVVQYEVERDPQGGEVLVRDGYFVHFFAPSELEPLPKHIVFVLDHSGSMSGRKIHQLIEAMQNILSDLKPNDLFNIIRFADEAFVWNAESNHFSKVIVPSNDYGHLEPHLREANLPDVVNASAENIEKAKNIINDTSDMGLTNIIAGLEVGLFLIKKTQEKMPNKYQPMIVFLTDGYPNVGMGSGEEITKTVTKLNSGEFQAAIFSLSFGHGADKEFLKKLSSKNLGLSRHIYEAADASLQLQDFYKTISSPLLKNITFKYVDEVSQVTKTQYPIFFEGSELVVAGKTGENPNILLNVGATCTTGHVVFNTTRTEPVSSIERLWAYLTVKQILKESETVDNKTELTQKALDLALKYSFVTSVSSLVVVKPNQTNFADSRDASSMPEPSESMPASFSGYRSTSLISSRRIAYNTPLQLGSFGPPASPGLFGPPGLPGQAYLNRAGPHTYRPQYYQPMFSLSTTYRPFTQNSNNIPQWLENMRQNNENITFSQGTFKLGQSGDIGTSPNCSNSALNNGTGVCTIIFDCPEVFSYLTDMNTYLKYFCPLKEYAGVCCPEKIAPMPL